MYIDDMYCGRSAGLIVTPGVIGKQNAKFFLLMLLLAAFLLQASPASASRKKRVCPVSCWTVSKTA